MVPKSQKVRILIVDDHPIFREGLRYLLGAEPDLEVIGEAGDGEEALRKVATLRPNLVLLDLAMPQLGGLDVLDDLVLAGSCHIMLLTAGEDEIVEHIQ